MKRSDVTVALVVVFGVAACAVGALVLCGVPLLTSIFLLRGPSNVPEPEVRAIVTIAPTVDGRLTPTQEPIEILPSTPLPETTPWPSFDERDLALESALAAIELTPRDPVALAVALQGVDPADIPEPGSVLPRQYEVGDIETFWITNNDTRETRQIEAELMAATEHAYMWLDTDAIASLPGGGEAGREDFLAAAQRFERSYQAVRAVFGEEPSPGVDGDVHIYVLHSADLGAVGGYFSAGDLLPPSVSSVSCGHEMIFVSTWGAGGVGGSYYNTTLAHEFQHMIHQAQDPNEESWINEGMSELAQQIAGMTGDDWIDAYLAAPDIQLTFWPPDGDTTPYYGGNFLFAEYMYERFGEDFIADLVADSLNGQASVDAALAAIGYDGNGDDLFDEWAVALYLDDPSLGDGRYGFQEVSVRRPTSVALVRNLPEAIEGGVNQYGLDYIRLVDLSGPVQISFTGSNTVPIVSTQVHSGEMMWWSNRGDYSTMTLTREVDLTGVSAATLNFWTWYDIELDWDYAYVMASTDGGQTWDALETPISTTTDPTGNNYGNGITGASDDWVPVTVDLSPYAGQMILLQFALITDDAAHLEHIVIDDIEIPEIGFYDDVEGGANGWVADGFIQIHNRLPQHWSLQAIVLDGSPEVVPVEVTENGTAALTLDIPSGEGGAVLIVSAQTRYTLSPASYRIELTAP